MGIIAMMVEGLLFGKEREKKTHLARKLLRCYCHYMYSLSSLSARVQSKSEELWQILNALRLQQTPSMIWQNENSR